MWNFIKELRRKDHQRYLGGLDFFKAEFNLQMQQNSD